MLEVLGHRLEGHRQKDEKESQTFRAMVGKKIMPEFLKQQTSARVNYDKSTLKSL